MLLRQNFGRINVYLFHNYVKLWTTFLILILDVYQYTRTTKHVPLREYYSFLLEIEREEERTKVAQVGYQAC